MAKRASSPEYIIEYDETVTEFLPSAKVDIQHQTLEKAAKATGR
jgi:hypothetical protein